MRLNTHTGDVPMARVKMNAKHEYEFIANYKILQNVFRAKKIDKARTAFEHSLSLTLTGYIAHSCR